MIAGLARFVTALRGEGVDASPAELLDATRAAELTGVEDRVRFRAALRATLAKGRRQQEIFDRVFERHFAPPARGAGRRRGGRGPGGTGLRRGAGPLDDPASDRGRRAEATDRARPGRERRPTDMADRESAARAMRAALERTREGGRRPAGRLRRVVLESRTVESEARDGPGARPAPGRRDLSQPMTERDERELAREVPRLIAEIRLGRSLRRRAASRGRLSLRDVFRRNLARGGVPFELPLRRPRARRPQVVLLVDVSHSVARAAGYFLWIAAAFLTLDRRTRVLLFVDRPVDATRAVTRWLRVAPSRPAAPARSGGGAGPRGRRPGAGIRPGGASFHELLGSLRGLDPASPSDYGTALHRLLGSAARPAGRDTILVVLGDGRTNRFAPLPWALEELARNSRAVLWLVPEPRSRWGTGDSALGAYTPWIDTLVEAWNLAGLARGVRELVRELR